MKKLSVPCLLLILTVFTNAQLPVLWGTASSGGANSHGTIYNLHSDGSNFNVAYNYGLLDSGSYPQGSLFQASNGLLYGMTSGISPSSSTVDSGYLFCYNPATRVFTNLYKFDFITGAYPYGNLMQATNGLLYGMTQGGGATGNGTIFSFNTTTNKLTVLFSFPSLGFPYGTLMQASNGLLYGMTLLGGISSAGGNIFSFDPGSNAYADLYDFPAGTDPWGSLMQATNGLLYGMTTFGGANGDGSIFSYNTELTGPTAFTDIIDFDDDGSYPGVNPYGSLIQATDGNLYGLTSEGGANETGVLFSLNPTTHAYADVLDLGYDSGDYPYGSPFQASDGNIYVMASADGHGNYGSVFYYTPGGAPQNYTIMAYLSTGNDGSTYSGANPYGNPIQAANGLLYGLTIDGGNYINPVGNLFSLNISNSTWDDLVDFSATTYATYPYGNALMQGANGQLYGMTTSGGTGADQFSFFGGDGAIYSFDPVSDNYSELYDFISEGRPYGTPVLASNGLMYGMGYGDGANMQGTVFSLDTFGNYTDLYDFTNGDQRGTLPQGSFVQATNGLLYGMTASGGLAGGEGVLFSYDPANPSIFPVPLYDFTGGTDGGVPGPGTSLIQATNGLLYGTTEYGGLGAGSSCFCGTGVIFSFDPAHPSNPPITVYSFSADGSTGGYPVGSLVQASNGLLYGMTSGTGPNYLGVLYSFNPNTAAYTVLLNFSTSTGGNPDGGENGSLYQASDGNLYGATTDDGTGSGDGEVFQYNFNTSTYTPLYNLSSVTVDGTQPVANFMELRKITTPAVAGSPLCAGGSVNVPFVAAGYYTYINVFTAQLSDASGSFSSPVNIGTLSGDTSGTINATIPGGANGTRYRIRVVSSSPVITGTDNGSNIVINSCASVNTWLGTTNDWGLSTNWSSGSVPSCEDVEDLIPVTSNNPVISVAENASNLVINDGVTLTVNAALSVCGNLTGGSSRVATVQGTTALTLTGTALQTITGLISFQNQLALDNTLGSAPQAELAAGAVVNIYDAVVLQNNNTLDASSGTLTLKSTSVTEAAIIDNFSGSNSGTVTGNITAERFYGSATASNDFKQHMLGSPVSGIDLSALGSTAGSSAYYEAATGGIHNCNELLGAPGTPYGNVFSYDETHASTCTMDGWEIGAASTSVSAGTGYSVVLGSGSGTLSLTGTANLSSGYTPSTTNSGYSNTTSDQGRVYSSGINLVSNPYPAVLSVSALNTANAANFSGQTIYVWNVGTGAYDMNPATIAPFQAFKVIQSAAGSKTYSIPGTARTISAGTFQRTTNPIELNMSVTNNSTGLTDNTIVGFNSNSTAQFDPSFDVIKLPGALTRHTMYSLNSNYWLAINVLKSINETSTVPVGFEPGVSATYTADFGGLTSFDPTSYIMLEDLQTGTMFNVRDGEYTFTSDASSDSWNRFILHFTPPASITATDATCSEQGLINIVQPGTAIWNYTLADNNNVTLSSGTLNANSQVNASVPAGVYSLALVDNNGYTVVKTIEVNGVQPVIASFISSANTVGVNQEVTLSSTAAGAIINSWNFGDGTTGNGTTVSHTYSSEGVYNVTLNSTSVSGCTSSASNTVTVTQSVTGLSNLNDINNIVIWSNEGIVNIDFSQLSEVQANIEIYNILGQKLSDDKYVTNTVYHKQIPNIEEGYIVVSVKNNDEIISKKLFISNIK